MKWTWLGLILHPNLAARGISLAFVGIPALSKLAAILGLFRDTHEGNLALLAGFVGAIASVVAFLAYRWLAPAIITAESRASDFADKRTQADFTDWANEVAKAEKNYEAGKGSFFNAILQHVGATTILALHGSDEEIRTRVIAEFKELQLSRDQRMNGWKFVRERAAKIYPVRRWIVTILALVGVVGLGWFSVRNWGVIFSLFESVLSRNA